MSFLELNGWALPVIRAVHKVKEIGSRKESFSGGELRDRRTAKDIFQCNTPPLSERDANALIGLVQGNGDGVSAKQTDSTYSSKGEAASASVLTLQGQYSSANPRHTGDKTGAEALPAFGVGSQDSTRQVEPATSNILPADARNAENAPTGYTGIALTPTGDTTYYWQGSKSVKALAPSGSGERGVYASANPGTGSNGKTYIGSVWVYCHYTALPSPTSRHPDVYLYDATNATTSALVTVDCTDDKWHRIYVSHTITGGDSSDLRLVVSDQNVAIQFFCDAWQIEEQPSGWPAYPTAWVDGSRAAGDWTFPGLVQGKVEASACMCYATAPASPAPSSNAVLLKFSASYVQRFTLYRPAGTTSLILYVKDAYGLSSQTLTATDVWDDEWHLIAAVCRPQALSGQNTLEIWVDGVLAASSTAALNKNYGVLNATGCEIGHEGNSNFWLGYIGHWQLVPYASATEQIKGAYTNEFIALNEVPRMPPDLALRGDISEKALGLFKGRFIEARNFQGRKTTSWSNNLRKLKFELREK